MKEAAVSVKRLTVVFDSTIALEDVSFTLKSPFFAVVMGPNGAGKTTLLKALVGLVRPVSGHAKVYGYDPFKEAGTVRRFVSYVPQVINIDVHVPATVEEVVAMGALSRTSLPRLVDRRVKAKVVEALAQVKLEGARGKLFSELSGGQMQRALIARALLSSPRLLLLDEPFSMLDFESRREIAELIYELHIRLGIDVLIVAHELSSCAAYEPTVVLLNRRVYAVGSAHEVLTIGVLRKVYPGLTESRGLLILGEDHG